MKKCLLDIALMECPRCGAAHQMEFFELSNWGYAADFNLFGTCPTTQEPVFVSIPQDIPNAAIDAVYLPLDTSEYKRILEAKSELPAGSQEKDILLQLKSIIGTDKDVVQYIKDLQQAAINLRAYLMEYLQSGAQGDKVRAMVSWLGILLQDRSPKFENHILTENTFKVAAPPPFCLQPPYEDNYETSAPPTGTKDS